MINLTAYITVNTANNKMWSATKMLSQNAKVWSPKWENAEFNFWHLQFDL